MIQRLQSLYLLAVVFFSTLVLLLFFHEEKGMLQYQNYIYFLVIVLSIWSIFSFRKRNFQILLNTISSIINILLLGFLGFVVLTLSGGLQSLPEKGIEFLFPLLNVFALFLANKSIKKDEKLVKSVDRFR